MSRHFFLYAATVSVLAFLFLGAFNAAVDPHDAFDHQWAPPRETDFVALKQAQWQETGDVDVVVFGSSRAFTYPPEALAQRWNGTAFNWAVQQGGTVSDLSLLVDSWAREDRMPATLLVSLDLRRFLTGVAPSLVDSRAYEDIAGHPLPLENRLGRARDLVAWTTVQDSLAALQRQVSGSTEPWLALQDDGWMLWPQQDERLLEGSWDQEERIASHYTTFVAPSYAQDQVQERPWMDLDHVLDVAESHGTNVTLFLSPTHPTVLEWLKDTSYPKVHEDVREGLRELCPRATVLDPMDAAALGLDVDEFYDGNHFSPRMAEAVLDHVQERTGDLCVN